MAAASSNPVPQPTHSPRSAVEATAVISSPRSRRGSAPRGVSSPWSHVVRGVESDLVISSSAAPVQLVSTPPPVDVQELIVNSPSSDRSPPKSVASASMLAASVVASSSAMVASLPDELSGEALSQGSENGNNNASKKSAWSKPSNAAAEVGSVMGAVSWPALSESTRASSKSSSSDLLKPTHESLEPLSQGAGMVSSSSHKQITSNHSNSSPSHGGPNRQKSFKRGVGNSSNSVSANGDFSHPTNPLTHGSVGDMNPISGKSGRAGDETSSRDHVHKEGVQRGGFGHGGNDHQPQRNTSRRGNGGPHPRGDGSYHHNHGGRRDHERGNQDWNASRNFGNRDAHIQQQRAAPRGFIRPPPHNSAPFVPPPVPMRPFGNAMLYSELAPPVIFVPAPVDSLRGVPMVSPMPPSHPMFFPVPDSQLHAKIDTELQTNIVMQIDYYFSNENLIKDTFLRQNMDAQGWVSLQLIAGFKKVRMLTDDIQTIVDALRTSTVVEVQGLKVRKQNDWVRWIMPSHVQFSSVSSPQQLTRSGHDMLVTHVQSFNLDDNIRRGNSEVLLSRSSSGESNFQPQHSSGNMAVQINVQPGDEHSSFNRSSSR